MKIEPEEPSVLCGSEGRAGARSRCRWDPWVPAELAPALQRSPPASSLSPSEVCVAAVLELEQGQGAWLWKVICPCSSATMTMVFKYFFTFVSTKDLRDRTLVSHTALERTGGKTKGFPPYPEDRESDS